ANFWVPSASCTLGCSGNNLFYSNKSSTFREDGRRWGLIYEDGSYAQGFLGIDTVTVINIGESGTKQMKITEQIFGLATEKGGFVNQTIDGVFGMGFSALADHQIPTPISQAYEQGAIESPMFTVWLQHNVIFL
ncbi:unnamed protein product, partial [Gongylonema pulchrum]|uniref:Peptidase A1 domain-containing protein n=1 Tax=Gongylonema pulchrum TaxID=637853 RepID=A0A183D8G2_9BILA